MPEAQQSFDPADLLLQWDGCLLGLQAIARPDFVDDDFIHMVPLKTIRFS